MAKPQLRLDIRDSVLRDMFLGICVNYVPKLNMKNVNERYGGLFIDGFVAYMTRECVECLKDKYSFMPVLFVEIDQNQLDSGSDHKSNRQ